jgi:gluconolactonase
MSNKAFAGLAACAALAMLLNPSSPLAQAPAATPPAPIMPPLLPASHVVDLMTAEGSAALGAQWKVSDVRIVEVPAIPDTVTTFKTTYNIEPRAGAANFDDSKWPTIEAKDLGARRSGGHVAFMWYRAMLTMPAKIGAFDTANAVTVLNVLVDDYAEVWVNGDIRRGSCGPATMQGHNMPNRVVLSTKVTRATSSGRYLRCQRPDLGRAAGSIWFRQAKLQLYK